MEFEDCGEGLGMSDVAGKTGQLIPEPVKLYMEACIPKWMPCGHSFNITKDMAGIVEGPPCPYCRIADLESRQRWIPVSESLPETTGPYLVIEDDEIYLDRWHGDGWHSNPPDLCCIEYWLPIPPPPEREQ